MILYFVLPAGECHAQDTLWWKKEERLRWEDFQGFPDTTEVFEALTYAGISFSYSYTGNSFTFKAATYFNRAKSWRLPIADSGKLRHDGNIYPSTYSAVGSTEAGKSFGATNYQCSVKGCAGGKRPVSALLRPGNALWHQACGTKKMGKKSRGPFANRLEARSPIAG